MKNEKSLPKSPAVYYVLLILSLPNKAWETITTRVKKKKKKTTRNIVNPKFSYYKHIICAQ